MQHCVPTQHCVPMAVGPQATSVVPWMTERDLPSLQLQSCSLITFTLTWWPSYINLNHIFFEDVPADQIWTFSVRAFVSYHHIQTEWSGWNIYHSTSWVVIITCLMFEISGFLTVVCNVVDRLTRTWRPHTSVMPCWTRSFILEKI